MRLLRVMAAIAAALAVGAPALPASPLLPRQQVTPGQCLEAALADLDRIEWAVRNAELVISGTTMDRLLGGGYSYSAEQIAEAERTQRDGPARIAAARAEVARWRATGARPSPDPSDYVPAQLNALLQRCLATQATPASTAPVQTPVATAGPPSSQAGPERWVYVAANGGGFGWREPPAGSIPSTVEVISRTSAPIMIAGREARWSYYTVRLNCPAQTTTVTSHVITTETGERIADVPEGPKPISSDTPPQAAEMVICNRAELPDSRVAGSREATIAALRGAGSSSDAPAPGATDRAGSAAGSRAASEVSPPLRSAAANESLGLPAETTNAFRAAAAVLVPPITVWETDYMRPEETLYALAPDAPNAAFYRSVSRPAGYGRHEMWVVAVLRAVSTDPAGAYDLGASLYSIDCEARTTQVLRGRVYRDMAPARDTPIEPVQPLQPGTVAHQMIIQVCDNAPAPAVAGTLAEVRRRVPLD